MVRQPPPRQLSRLLILMAAQALFHAPCVYFTPHDESQY